MKVGSLFSGIGGFDLGLVRAGMEIAWQVEIDPFCQKVLKKHAPEYWPNAKLFGDIKNVTKEELCPVDLICGGFPCQPFSNAGKRKGKADDRYLWPEMLRIIRELSPRWIIGENVAGFINMELENAFTDLEAEGYKIEAFVLPALGIGALHKRERIWIMAYPKSSYAGQSQDRATKSQSANNQSQWRGLCNEFSRQGSVDYWKPRSQPELCRVANGVPYRMDRLRSLGNAVVPQLVEILGHCIIEIDFSA